MQDFIDQMKREPSKKENLLFVKKIEYPNTRINTPRKGMINISTDLD